MVTVCCGKFWGVRELQQLPLSNSWVQEKTSGIINCGVSVSDGAVYSEQSRAWRRSLRNFFRNTNVDKLY